MKKINLLLTILLLILLASCKEKESVQPETMPTAELPCVSDTFSWTEYNWPDVALEYFRSHEEEVMLHAGDTIRLAGWIAANSIDDAIETYHINHFGQMFLTTHQDHTYSYGSEIGIYEPTPYENPQDLCFLNHFEEWWPNKLYVTGLINHFEVEDSMDYSCKGHKLMLVNAINVNF